MNLDAAAHVLAIPMTIFRRNSLSGMNDSASFKVHWEEIIWLLKMSSELTISAATFEVKTIASGVNKCAALPDTPTSSRSSASVRVRPLEPIAHNKARRWAPLTKVWVPDILAR